MGLDNESAEESKHPNNATVQKVSQIPSISLFSKEQFRNFHRRYFLAISTIQINTKNTNKYLQHTRK